MSQLTEKNIRDYLIQHPEWLQAQTDLWPQGNTSKVKDFRDAQLAKLQLDKEILIERQKSWLEALQVNENLSQTLWQSAAKLAKANGYQAVLKVLDQLLFESLVFPEYALKLNVPHNKRPVPKACVVDEALAICEIKAYSHLPSSMVHWLAKPYANHLLVPLLFENHVVGAWLIASEQQDYFHKDLDTSYLQMYADVLGSTLARIMGIPSSC